MKWFTRCEKCKNRALYIKPARLTVSGIEVESDKKLCRPCINKIKEALYGNNGKTN